MRQTKRTLGIIAILTIVAMLGCNSGKEVDKKSRSDADKQLDVTTIFKNQFKKLNLLHYRKGNFTGLGKDEYIVFYEDPSHRYEPDQRNINKIIIFTMMTVGRPKLYEINDSSSYPYDDEALTIITNKKLQFGTWNGYCRIADYNENGLDEVMFFALFGSGFVVDIYEYHNGKMERVLESPPTYSDIISGVETIVENNKKYIKVYGSGGGEKPGEIIPKGYRDWYLYSWNKEIGKYEIIEKGTEKWN